MKKLDLVEKSPLSETRKAETPKKKRSVILLIAAIIATICMIFIVSYMNDATGKDGMTSDEKMGAEIAMFLASPSVMVSGIGTIFAWLGWLCKMRGFALTAGILFAVAMLLMIPWAMFNVIQMVLCFVAFARMKKA